MSKLDLKIYPQLLHFKQPAGTSRGAYTTRRCWYVRITSSDSPIVGRGENVHPCRC